MPSSGVPASDGDTSGETSPPSRERGGLDCGLVAIQSSSHPGREIDRAGRARLGALDPPATRHSPFHADLAVHQIEVVPPQPEDLARPHAGVSEREEEQAVPHRVLREPGRALHAKQILDLAARDRGQRQRSECRADMVLEHPE